MIKIFDYMPIYIIPTKEQKDKFIEYCRNIVLLDAPLMDTYLLARDFRKFKQIKYQNSNEPENIIIFVGEYHAGIYRYIIKIRI